MKGCVFCNFKDPGVLIYADEFCYAIISKFHKDQRVIDWSKLRLPANKNERSKFANEVRKHIKNETLPVSA